MDRELSLAAMDDGGGFGGSALADTALDAMEAVWQRPPPPRPTASTDHAAARRLDSIDAEILGGQDTATLAGRVGIAVQTAREWRRLGRVPAMWLRAARALVLGDLGVIDDAWRGWRIRAGTLASPDGGDYHFSVADVMSLPHTRLRLAEAERELDRQRTPPPPPEPLTLQSDIFGAWTRNAYTGADVDAARHDAMQRAIAEQQARELRALQVSAGRRRR
jgi:hypothetical protein